MPYIRIMVHAVWTVKNRKPLMNKTNKDALCRHIRKYSKSKDINLININGWSNHLHALIALSADQNLATIMHHIKGESSHWANRNLEWKEKFGWQNEYYAVSVSRSHEDAVNHYISTQEVHHKVKTFQEEYDQFIKKYSFTEI